MTTLPDPRPTRDKDAALVQAMFDRVAPATTSPTRSCRSDRTATGAGWPRGRWRRSGERVLDVASGTGALAHELRAAGAQVVALDFSWNMLHAGAVREGADRTLLWANGDGTRLPFADATFDGVTIAFGLRNLPDPAAGLREFARVTRPGGRLVVLEFSHPTWAPLRAAYEGGVLAALPAVARAITSDPRAYGYLARSIRAWPDQERLARTIAAAGWTRPRWKDLTGGIVAAHHAVAAM